MPHRYGHEAAAKCINCIAANKAQVQDDKYNRQGKHIVSGALVSGGRQIVGLRLIHPGSRWCVTGANAVLAVKCCVMYRNLADFLHWKTQQAVAA